MFRLLDGRRLQASIQTLFDIMLRANYLNVPAKHFFPILIFIPIHSCAMVHLLLKMQEQELFWFGKECKWASDKLHAAPYNYAVTCSLHMKWKFGSILCTRFLYSHFFFSLWQEGNYNNVTINVTRQAAMKFWMAEIQRQNWTQLLSESNVILSSNGLRV